MTLGSEAFISKIPVLKPRLPNLESISSYIERIDLSGSYSNNGPLVRELESRYAGILGVEPQKVIAVSNATLGITLAVQNQTPNLWRVPDFTFGATALAVLNAGKQLMLEDVDEKTWDLQLPSQFTEENVGHLVVMPFGNNSSFSKWKTISNVVFDAAASIGDPSWDLGKLTHTHTVVFSLHATKVFGAGEGGLIVCGNPLNADLIRCSINFGFNSARHISTLGTNAKMSEYSAAIALASLDQKNIEISEWETSQQLARNLASQVGHRNPNLEASPVNPYFLLRFKDENSLINFENSSTQVNIETRRWWPLAIHEMPFFSEQPRLSITHKLDKKSVSVALSSTILGLPMSRDLSNEFFRRITPLFERFESTFHIFEEVG